jgi:hypothetical protein
MKKKTKRRKIVLKVYRIHPFNRCLQCYLREFYYNFSDEEICLCDIFQGIFNPQCYIRDLKIIGYEKDIYDYFKTSPI